MHTIKEGTLNAVNTVARFEGSQFFDIFLSVAFFIAHDLLKIEDGVAGTHSASTLRTSLSSSFISTISQDPSVR